MCRYICICVRTFYRVFFEAFPTVVLPAATCSLFVNGVDADLNFALSKADTAKSRKDWASEGGGILYRMWSTLRRKWRDAPNQSNDSDIQDLKNLCKPAEEEEEWPVHHSIAASTPAAPSCWPPAPRPS